MEKKQVVSFLLALVAATATAQSVLTLERCRELALQNNKQLKMSKLNQDVAESTRKAADTKRLPRVSGMAGYEHFSREVSLLNKDQKSALSNLGTHSVSSISSRLNESIADLVQRGIISQEAAQQFGIIMEKAGEPLAALGNEIGQSIRDAFRTDTRNIWAGSIMVTQPIYMGGAISTAREMACISEEMAHNNVDNVTQNTLFAIDNAYWLTVSLRNKQQLAKDYLSLVKKLDDDVKKMIREGVATRADGLKVDVAVNEAEMQLTSIDDGVTLSKMYLCQLCGLPISGDITLADEGKEGFADDGNEDLNVQDSTFSRRPEIRMLENAISLSRLSTRLIQAEYRPHVALTGGVMLSNPNMFNGFERKFKEVWSIGVIVQVPIWNWHEGRYKADATRTATAIAQLELADAREKMQLQVEQNRFKLEEARKRLQKATENMESANENLRCANVGFREGVMTITDVMEAQTAWQKSETQKIDAEIDVKLAQVGLRKALGI